MLHTIYGCTFYFQLEASFLLSFACLRLRSFTLNMTVVFLMWQGPWGSSFFGRKRQGKPQKKRILIPTEPLKILGKEVKNAPKNKEHSKKKERKDRVWKMGAQSGQKFSERRRSREIIGFCSFCHPDNPYPLINIIRGAEFTPLIKGVGLKKHYKTRGLGQSAPP